MKAERTLHKIPSFNFSRTWCLCNMFAGDIFLDRYCLLAPRQFKIDLNVYFCVLSRSTYEQIFVQYM